MSRRWMILGGVLASLGVLTGQAGGPREASGPSPMVEVAVEQAQGRDWRGVDPRTVFRPDEEIRFRFRATFPGFLYVLDRTPKGEYLWLFPNSKAGLENRVEPGRVYQIPSTEGAFRIPATPGFDTIYWILSPVVLDRMMDWSPQETRWLSPLLPRCQASTLRSRGQCLDETAGARPWRQTNRLPLPQQEPLLSRELTFTRSSDTSQITVNGPVRGAVVYEFWVAHH